LETKQPDPSVVAHGDAYLTLSKLYVLAEKLIDETAKTAVLAAMSKHGEGRSRGTLGCPGFESISIIYNGTPDNSPARKCMLDLYTKCVAEDASLEVFPSEQNWPRDFLSDLIKSVITSWARPSTHAALEHRLAQTEAEYERSKENARTWEEEYNRLDAVTAHLKAKAGVACQRAQQGETVIRQLENQVQKLEDELVRQRDSYGRERDNLKPEGDKLKRKGDKLEREEDKLNRQRRALAKEILRR
jgi:hypothetical protein